ncbi:PLP-dependent aminotransferase family protein [Flexivirga meconopsidis]|uniref:MocR-like pyridoxine biosynthesis transcription factor PdxR n=1 Tax=Flexivirga meconopsidis TaxID=2977121 RepID=UPI00223F142F|nr:PLP-dependent aminotransferase family protein [Flexivirga meconopsidis]
MAEARVRAKEVIRMALTLLQLDRDSAEPLYRQARRALENAVTTGLFDLDQPLPSSRALADELGVSRNTIKLAYEELIAEGIVISHERKGLFVNPDVQSALINAPDRTPGIDWSRRTRGFPDARLPHIEKVADWSSYPYPFLAGQVDVRSFPVRAWQRALRESLYHPHIYPSLQDSLGSDDPMLVDVVRRQLLPARGIEAEPEEILITVGSQHGLDLLGRSLLGSRSTVAVESPGYLDARHIFARTGAALRPMSVDGDGAVPPTDFAGIDLAYVTPSHQSPTNVTLPMERRLHFVQRAAAAGTVLVEDDYDSEFRYQGRPSPALKALDNSGDVVYLGTFSKFLSPGLRLGYLVAHRDLVRELAEIRRYELRHPAGQLQRAMALFIGSGDYHRALRRQKAKLQQRWLTMTDAVERLFPFPTGDFPPGGVSLWMRGPEGFDARVLAERARGAGVLIEPGDVYFPAADAHARRHFRLGYVAIPLRAIEPGVRVLAELIRELP